MILASNKYHLNLSGTGNKNNNLKKKLHQFIRLSKSLKKILVMEPHARIARCFFQWERIAVEWCGFNFIAEKFKPSILTYFVYTLVIIAIFGCVYTIAYYDISSKVFCVLLLLMMIQVNIQNDFYFTCNSHSLLFLCVRISFA